MGAWSSRSDRRGLNRLKMAAGGGKFTRFSEKRDHQVGQSTTCRVPSVDLVLVQSNDTTTYDDAVDAIEPDESSGLHIPIQKVTAATCTTAFVSSEVDCRDLSVCAGRRTPCIPPVCRRMLVLG